MLDFNFSGLGSVALFILVLSVLVFVHELGHFLAARFFKIHIEEFAIGFPPRAIGAVHDKNNRLKFFFGQNIPSAEELGGPKTIYSLNWLPIGGFVRPAGEDNPGIAGGLASASKTARLVVLAAGSTFNLLFAVLVFTVGFRLGWPDRVQISEVVANSPAAVGGMRTDDILLTVQGTEIHYPQQVSQVVYARLGLPVEITVERGGQTVALIVTPRTLEQTPEGQGPMGISMSRSMVTNYSWPQAFSRALREIAFQFEEMAALPGRLIRGEMPLAAARPIGIVGMNDLTAMAVETAVEINQWFPVIQLIGLISVALGLTNLLPLPALDGGRILFVLIEAIRGRRVDPAREGFVHMIGMVILLGLMVIITYQDIVNPLIPR